jgi:hypothetical protein
MVQQETRLNPTKPRKLGYAHPTGPRKLGPAGALVAGTPSSATETGKVG